jgi:hypothetical protein
MIPSFLIYMREICFLKHTQRKYLKACIPSNDWGSTGINERPFVVVMEYWRKVTWSVGVMEKPQT